MTEIESARVQIWCNKFRARYKDINPYSWGGDACRKWYATHSILEPIPKEMLPTDKQLRHFDIMEALYIASNLARNSDYTTLLAYGEWAKNRPIEEAVWKVIAGTRPCGCKEGQCSFFCQYYGTENCYNKNSVIRNQKLVLG